MSRSIKRCWLNLDYALSQPKIAAMRYGRLLYIGVLAIVVLLSASCIGRNTSRDSELPKEVAEVGHPASSPSGKYELHVIADKTKKPTELSFEVKTKNGDVVFHSTDAFSDRHMTYFLWDEADRVWVYSGDLGTFFWEQNQNNWQKYAYVDEEVSAPKFLKEQRPRWHKK